jgi:hypothetical protein
MLKSIQNSSLRFVSFKFNIFRHPYSSYDIVLNSLSLTSLTDRRLLLLTKLLHKLLSGVIDYPELLSLINF